MTKTFNTIYLTIMRFLAILILLGFMSVMFCGITTTGNGGIHTMASHSSTGVAHHTVSMYESISTAVFSDSTTTFAMLISVLAFVLVAFFLQIRSSSVLFCRHVRKRHFYSTSTYKLKRWIALFVHSPSLA